MAIQLIDFDTMELVAVFYSEAKLEKWLYDHNANITDYLVVK